MHALLSNRESEKAFLEENENKMIYHTDIQKKSIKSARFK